MDVLRIFAEDVDFDVKQGAGHEGAEAGGGIGVGNDGNFDLVAGDRGDSEADALDGNGALFYDVPGEIVRDGEVEAVVGFSHAGVDWVERDERSGAVYVALDNVAAEGRAGGCGEFEVDGGTGFEMRKSGAGDGLCGEVSG